MPSFKLPPPSQNPFLKWHHQNEIQAVFFVFEIGSHNAAQAGVELKDIPASVLQVLGLQVSAIAQGSYFWYSNIKSISVSYWFYLPNISQIFTSKIFLELIYFFPTPLLPLFRLPTSLPLSLHFSYSSQNIVLFVLMLDTICGHIFPSQKYFTI